MITCDDAQERMSARLDGELDAADLPALEAHLQDCAPCRALLAEFEAMHAALSAWDPAAQLVPPVRLAPPAQLVPPAQLAPPARLAPAVMAEIHAAKIVRPAWKQLHLRGWASLAAVCVLALLGAGTFQIWFAGGDGSTAPAPASAMVQESAAPAAQAAAPDHVQTPAPSMAEHDAALAGAANAPDSAISAPETPEMGGELPVADKKDRGIEAPPAPELPHAAAPAAVPSPASNSVPSAAPSAAPNPAPSAVLSAAPNPAPSAVPQPNAVTAPHAPLRAVAFLPCAILTLPYALAPDLSAYDCAPDGDTWYYRVPAAVIAALAETVQTQDGVTYVTEGAEVAPAAAEGLVVVTGVPAA